MRVGVPKEMAEGERRVALIADTVASLAKQKIEVSVESGAGDGAGQTDSAYADEARASAPVTTPGTPTWS